MTDNAQNYAGIIGGSLTRSTVWTMSPLLVDSGCSVPPDDILSRISDMIIYEKVVMHRYYFLATDPIPILFR